MTDLNLELRHGLCVKYSIALCFLILTGFLARLVIASQYPVVISLAAVHLALAIPLYLMVRSARHPKLEAPLLLALSLSSLIPMLLITGGVNSQLTSLLVCLPFVAALLGDRKLPFIALAVIVALMLAMLAANDLVVDVSGEVATNRKLVSRTLWLIIGVLVSTGVGAYFQYGHMQLTRKLQEQAVLDHLTGLFNRRGLETRLDEELTRQKRTHGSLALLLLDVDNFKLFNDKHGHAAGDRCLVALAKCLEDSTRAEDIVGRFGGEEFLVVLVNVTPRQAAQAAEKLRRNCARIELNGVQESVSVTIGMVFADASSTLNAEALIKRADDALYRGKDSGRNQVILSP